MEYYLHVLIKRTIQVVSYYYWLISLSIQSQFTTFNNLKPYRSFLLPLVHYYDETTLPIITVFNKIFLLNRFHPRSSYYWFQFFFRFLWFLMQFLRCILSYYIHKLLFNRCNECAHSTATEMLFMYYSLQANLKHIKSLQKNLFYIEQCRTI